MARFYAELNEQLQDFIAQQHLFFVATVPENGRINLSLKGMDSFCVLDSERVAFMNLNRWFTHQPVAGLSPKNTGVMR